MTLKLFVLSPNVAWTGLVNSSGFAFPVMDIPYDNGTALGTPMPGDTVLFGSVAGADDYGRQRLKVAPSGSSGTLQIGRSSQGDRDGEVKPVDNCHITILSLRQVWSKNPEILDDGTIYKDGDIEYDGQTAENSPPKANAGGGKVGTISGGSLSVAFNASLSFATADGASIVSILWDIDDGSVTSGTLSSASLTASFPAGFRYIYLTVTDSNGNTHTASTFVLAIDPANDPTIDNFEITGHTMSEKGQRLSVRILDPVPLDTYPDGTLVLLIDGEPTSAADRTNLKFAGWHQTNSDSTRAERTGIVSETVFDCMDIAGRLETLPGFPLSVQIAETPDSWLQMTLPNMDKYIHFLLMWHTNALELTDFVWSGTGDEFPFVILGSDGQSLWQQAARVAASFVPDYILTCNSRGQIRTIIDPMLQETADRTATVQAAITEDDWTEIRYTRQRPPRYHWLWSDAIKASHTEISPLFTVAPGEAPGQGLSSQPHGEQLAKSQLDLNNCEGHRYARLNAVNTFFDITLSGEDYNIEPSDLTWVTVTMSAATAAQRGYAFTAARGLVHEVNTSYDTGRTGTVKTITLRWEMEVTGVAALAHFPPDALPVPPWEPEPEPIASTPPSTAGDGLGTFYVMYGNGLHRTRSLSAVSPTYSLIDALSTTRWDWILDPWQPAAYGYLSTIDGVYRASVLDGVTPTWDLILSAAAAVSGAGATSFNNPAKILGSINSDGYVAVFWYGGDNNIYVSYTNTARGVTPTWAHASVTNAAGVFDGAADIVPRVISGNLMLYCATNTGSASNKTIKVYRSADGGATWAYRGDVYPVSSSNPLAYSLHCPYNDNPNGNVVYLAARVGSTALAGFYVSTDGGTSWTKVYGSVDPGDIHRWAFESYTQDRQKVYGVVQSTPHDVIKVSSNLFGTVESPAMSGFTGSILAAGGFPFLSSRSYLSGSDGVFMSNDRGETWIDKTGNLVVGTGRQAIVPLWVAE